MRRILYLMPALAAFFFFLPASSQPWLKQSLPSTVQQNKLTSNFYDVQRKFNEAWKDKKVSENEEENAEGGSSQQFRRWEWFMKQRTFPSGNYFNPDILFQEYKNYKTNVQPAQARTLSPNWSFIGPSVVPSGGGGSGRVNVIRFDPVSPSTMYLGAASGGVWKSTDGGVTWSSNTDFLSALSVADIAINPRNSDTLYAATGDGYGYEVGGDFWGGTYSAGILMSTDAGVTWNSTGLSYSQTQTDIIQRLVIHPVHPEILIAATRNGLFRTTNGGQTWTNVRTGHYYDIEFNTSNPDILYTSDQSSVYKSIDAGLTWTLLSSSLCSGRISLGTTAADPNVIYAFCESGNFYRSSDGGLTFSPQLSPNNLTTFYGYYDAVMAVSQLDANTVYCGGVNIVKSTDGGASWSNAANNGGGDYVHADNHFLDFYPGSNTIVFSGNDGGVFRTDNSGATWTDLSNTLGIKQYYRMSQSSSDPYTLYAGAQDNGTDRLLSGAWSQVYGADGMECLVDYSNDQNVYVSYQYGQIQKSTDGGNSFTSIAPSSGDWVTPYIIDPVSPQTLYAGYDMVYKTTNGGVNWNPISPSMFSGNLIALAISQANPSVMYAASLGTIARTDDGGANWTDITGTLPVGNAGITYIAISDYNPHKLWVTFTGYSSGEKVYASDDGGATWTNYSGSLPNVPVNCVAYQNLSTDVLYIGTDFGVFYRDSLSVDWVSYSTGLPNVIVDELEIQYGAGKLRAATYGRGLWEGDLSGAVAILLDAGVAQILSPAGSSCDSVQTPVVRIKNFGQDTLTSLTVNYSIDSGTPQVYLWTGSLATGATDDITLPAITLSSGTHTFNVTTSNPNGGTDQYIFNNSRIITFLTNTLIVPVPVAEGFQNAQLPPADWSITGAGAMLILDPTVGGFGLSTSSMYANYYYVSGATAYLSTPQMDFSSVAPPVQLAFNLAYAPYSSGYHDSLAISVSTDCGLTFSRIYAKGDLTLATSATTTSVFVPSPSDWRRDTVDLTGYIGNSSVLVRFDFLSGYGNNLYIDDINLTDNANSITSFGNRAAMNVYPNPTAGIVYFSFAAEAGSSYKLELTDMVGKQVGFFTVSGGAGLKHFPIDVSGYPSGMYQYRLVKDHSVVQAGKIIRN